MRILVSCWAPFLLAGAVGIALSSPSAAQPIRPPEEPKNERGPATAAVQEPGYLGLLVDERSEQGVGVRVVRVVERTPAADAGIEVNDIIVGIDGKPVTSLEDMAALLTTRVAGDKVTFEVQRAGSTKNLPVTLGQRPSSGERPFEFGRRPDVESHANERPPPPAASAPIADPGPFAPGIEVGATPRRQLLGIRTASVGEDARLRLRLPEAAGARVVSRVVGSPADRAGIPLESVIVAVNGQRVASPTELAQLIGAAGPGKQVEITYYSDGEPHKAQVTLANVAPPPPVADGRFGNGGMARRPIDGQATAPITTDRIEQLEQRVRELEQRVKELERALKMAPAPSAREREEGK